MSPLAGFSDNAFQTRTDLLRAALALLKPLEEYKSEDGGRIKIATATAAGFSEASAQLEGFARPLWVVADLLLLKNTTGKHDSVLSSTTVRLETWIQGLKSGTDPNSLEYWGNLSSFDQRMVEMESIAYALLLCPNQFDFANDPSARLNLINWLRQINEHNMPQNNWLWFRVFVNLALVRTLEVPLEEVKNHIDDSLRTLDTFYIAEGWSSDGLWGDDRKQADYYSGSFAIQFAQLLFIRSAPDYDEERTARYKKGAQDFGSEYWRYFSTNGAAIPFGRSLTYRFAFAAFWAAVSVADVQLPAPLSNPGAVKGMLLRHLRWWARKPHIFNTDGTPNIGYTYPNMYMAEDYNSPQSVFWCLKSFIVLGLAEEHPFWQSTELPHPLNDESKNAGLANVAMIAPPKHILCNTLEHHFLLSSGQSTSKKFKAREAKYGKFAYSSAFGFSVPVGQFIEQQAPDSTLAVSFADEEAWKVRWDPYGVCVENVTVGSDITPVLVSHWKPWKQVNLSIRTSLIPSMHKWPGWHLRIHKVSWKPSTSASLRFVDGGFAISAQDSQGNSIFERSVSRSIALDTETAREDWWSNKTGSLIISEAGASGILDLTESFISDTAARSIGQNKIIRADPNTNLIAQRSLIPVAEHILETESNFDGHGDKTAWFVTGVFAIERQTSTSDADVLKAWHALPKGYIDVNQDGRILFDTEVNLEQHMYEIGT